MRMLKSCHKGLVLGAVALGLLSCAPLPSGAKKGSTEAYYEGAGHYVSRNSAQALKELETALALDPSNESAKRLMLIVLREEAETLLEEKRFPEAQAKVQRLAAFYPEDQSVKTLLEKLKATRGEDPTDYPSPPPSGTPLYSHPSRGALNVLPPIPRGEGVKFAIRPPVKEEKVIPSPLRGEGQGEGESLKPEPLPKIESVPIKPETPTVVRPKASQPSLSLNRYLVREGETLESIALELYGDARRWTDIYWANQYQISRGILLPGQVLEMPRTSN